MTRTILLTASLAFIVASFGCSTLDEARPHVAGVRPEEDHSCELWQTWDEEEEWCY